MSQVVTPSNLGPEFDLGNTVANQIVIKTDNVGVIRDAGTGELSSPPGILSYDNTTTVLSYNDGQGTVQTVDLSALTSEIFIDNGSYDAATMELTLTDSDPNTPDVVIPLGGLLGVSTDASNILTNGTDGKPLLTTAQLDLCEDAFSNPLFYAIEA